MSRLRYNGLATGSAGSLVALALGASLTNSATPVTFNAALTYANGTAVPTIASPDYVPLEILDTSGHLTEIVWLTAYTSGGTTGTIVRGKEGTTGVAHSSGDKIVGGATVVDLGRYPLDVVTVDPTYGDHFTGSSLDAAWTRVGYTSTGESYQQGDGTWLQQDTSKTGGPNYYYRTAPAGDFTIVMSAVVYGSAIMFGPLILDGSSNGVAGFAYNNGDGHWVATVSAGGYSGSSAATISEPTTQMVNAGALTWYRLVKSGTSYTFTLSTNGKVWRPMTAAATSAITPTRIGFGNIIGTVQGFAVDFFDVQ